MIVGVFQENLFMKTLSKDFFARSTVEVARDLLGQLLVKREAGTGKPIICRIVETEAYTQEEPACHAYGRAERQDKGRAATMYKGPGLAYVYLIYGMYDCLNVVTEEAGRGCAVLIRAVEPVDEAFAELRTHGPGRLTKALGITKAAHNEMVLTDSTRDLFLAEGPSVVEGDVVQTTRIGITQAAELPWRFYVAGSDRVSVMVGKKR